MWEYLQWLDTEITTIGVPGVALGIVRANEVLDVRTWGVRSMAQQAPVDSKTPLSNCVGFQRRLQAP